MTATITIDGRHGAAVTVNNADTVHAIAAAVTAYNRGGGDQQFRVRRPSPNATRQSVVFKASEVRAVNADGIDLTDLGNPFDMPQGVAA